LICTQFASAQVAKVTAIASPPSNMSMASVHAAAAAADLCVSCSLFNVSSGSLHRPKYLTFDIPEAEQPAQDANETSIIEVDVSACSSGPSTLSRCGCSTAAAANGDNSREPRSPHFYSDRAASTARR
jgi:hypothetical protein